MAAQIETGEGFTAATPEIVFSRSGYWFPLTARRYDVAPDGRFLMLKLAVDQTDGQPSTELILVQNWFEELKRLVPAE